jgi:hypothetical protein
MTEYSFTLKFNFTDRVCVASAAAEALRDANRQLEPNSYIEQLYESGCDDALIGIGKQGCIALDFIREASLAFDAISHAISDVKTAIPNVTLIEAVPDFVGLDIAG